MSLFGLLVFLIVACVFVWAARKIMSAFSIGDPIATVVYVILVLLLLGAFLNLVGYGPNMNIRL